MAENLAMILLLLLTVNMAASDYIQCEEGATAQICQIHLNSNRTRCSDDSFRNTCPCSCEYQLQHGAVPRTRGLEHSPESAPDCSLDEQYGCDMRYRADRTICRIPNIMDYCPCTCAHWLPRPQSEESIEVTNPDVDSEIDDVARNNIPDVGSDPCGVDVPDSKMGYDCQYQISTNRRLCEDASYRKMCSCTCSMLLGRQGLQETLQESLLLPQNTLPQLPGLGNVPGNSAPVENTDPSRCRDHQAEDHGMGCFIRVSLLKDQPCPDDYRLECPCTCRAQDEGELCPDSPWLPLGGICQVRAANGRCSDLKVRDECPCTCALPDLDGPHQDEAASPPDGAPEVYTNECVDTATENQCSYYRTHNLCESGFGAQYCKRSCNKCLMENITGSEEPLVNHMPNVDQISDVDQILNQPVDEEPEHSDEVAQPASEEPTAQQPAEELPVEQPAVEEIPAQQPAVEEPTAAPAQLEDRAPSSVCAGWKERGLCPVRVPLCRKTCQPEAGSDSEAAIELVGDKEEEEEEDRNSDSPMTSSSESANNNPEQVETDGNQPEGTNGEGSPMTSSSETVEVENTGEVGAGEEGGQRMDESSGEEPVEQQQLPPRDQGPVETQQLPEEDQGFVNEEQLPPRDQEPVETQQLPEEDQGFVNEEQLPPRDQEPVEHQQLPVGDQGFVNEEQLPPRDQGRMELVDEELLPLENINPETPATRDQHPETPATQDQYPASTDDFMQESTGSEDQQEPQQQQQQQQQQPYEPEDGVTGETHGDTETNTRCHECERLITEMGCDRLDGVVRDYCEGHCDLCGAAENGDGNIDEDTGILIDNEGVVNQGPPSEAQPEEPGYVTVGGHSPAEMECEDRSPDCENYKAYCNHVHYAASLIINCRKTCDVC